jgi:hypothetical protein
MAKDSFVYWNTISQDIPKNVEPLTEEKKQKFLTNWKELVWTEDVQTPDGMLSNIRNLPPIILSAVPKWVMDRLKDSCDHYVRGQWLSSITVSGITAEWLTFYMLEKHVRESGIGGLIKHSRKLGYQDKRLEALKELGKLEDEEFTQLDRIRDIRNQYVHLDVPIKNGHQEGIKDDCLGALKHLIGFLNKRFEMKFHWESFKMLSDFIEEDTVREEEEDAMREEGS